MWICRYVDMRICGYADMWICRYVEYFKQVVNQEENFALLISAYCLQGSSKPGTKYGNFVFACCSQFRNKIGCIVKWTDFVWDSEHVVKEEDNFAILISAYCSQFRNKTPCILKCC